MIALHQSEFYSLPAQLVFVRDMILNLTSVIYWRVKQARKQRQVDQYIIQENKKHITYDYAVGNQLFVKNKGIIKNGYYQKRTPHNHRRF